MSSIFKDVQVGAEVPVENNTGEHDNMAAYRECKIILPALTVPRGDLNKVADMIFTAKVVNQRIMAISGGFTVMDGVGCYKGTVENVNIIYVTVKDDAQRFDLLTFAYWVKGALNQEYVYVQWDNGVVQFVGHPDDSVSHNWSF